MKVLFLLTQDLESPSGLGRYFPLARELAKRGHQVKIAALHSNFDSLTSYQKNQNGIEIDYVAPMHVMKSGNQKKYYSLLQLISIALRATLALTHAALKTPADLIIVGKPHPMNSIAGLSAKYLQRKKMVVDCDDYEAASGNFEGHWQRPIIAFFEKRVPRRANFVTTHTYFMKDKLIAWGVPAEKIIYLPNGIDVDRFKPPSSVRVATEQKNLKLDGKKVVAYIGSLSLSSHPVNLLLSAFQSVLSSYPDTVLLIVGGGEDFDYLQEMARQIGRLAQTRFVGRVRPENVTLYYQLADVTVEPVYDNDAARGRFPLKMLESWACGVPFVSADVGDRRMLLGSPPAGLLAQPGDAESLATAIHQILSDPGMAETFRQRGLERVRSYYWDQLAVELETIYQQTLKRRLHRTLS